MIKRSWSRHTKLFKLLYAIHVKYEELAEVNSVQLTCHFVRDRGQSRESKNCEAYTAR